jgi:hypothetical protein
MDFRQYLGGGGPDVGGDVVDRSNMVCFEDGTCMKGSRIVGTPQRTTGFSTTRNPHRIYGDGTSGPIVYTRNTVVTPNYGDGTGGPMPTGRPTASPSVGMAFAELLARMRRERGFRRPPEQRNRGDR